MSRSILSLLPGAMALASSLAAGTPPSLVSLLPAVSSGSNQVFMVTYNAPSGYQTLDVLNLLINTALDGRQACYLAYSRSVNALYIVADSGDATQLSGKVMDGTGTVSNSQCSVALASSSASGGGNTFSLVLSLTFSSSFAGNKAIYAAARDVAQNNSGWQTMGVHTVPGAVVTYPNPVGITPASGNTPAQTITFSYQDQSDATNLQTVWALINTAIDGRAACYVAYYRPGNQLYLYPDNGDGTQAAKIVLTGNNTLSNSQCSVSAQGASAQTSGNTLTVTLPITFTAAFAGFKDVWLAGQTMGGAQTSPWQALGALAVPVSATGPPTMSARAPISGLLGSTFVVFIPLVNTGTGTATNVLVTSATLGAASLAGPALPLPAVTLSPGDYSELDLQFGAANLVVGNQYQLSVQGSYQSAGQTSSFAVSWTVTVTAPSGATQTQLQHWVAIDAVRIEANSLPGLDAATDNQTLLAFLQSRPEFVESGIDVSSSSVWATFADGQKLIIENDPVPSPSSAAPGPRTSGVSEAPAVTRGSFKGPAGRARTLASQPSNAQATELPASSAVRLLDTISPLRLGPIDQISGIASMLQNQNYGVTEPDASVDNLKAVGGDGVFYFSSHGGFYGDGTAASPLTYGVWTSTKADIGTDLIYPVSDVYGTASSPPLTSSPPTLIHAIALAYRDQLTGNLVEETHYAITAQFVRTYFKNFSANSFVYIDACSSDDPRPNTATFLGAQDFKQALFGAGASVYAGWSAKSKNSIALNSALLVFDRLLGANQFFLETLPTASGAVFKQRPFPWTALATNVANPAQTGDLELHNLGVDTSSGAVLNFTPNAKMAAANVPVFGLLTPSIGTMAAFEYLPNFPGQSQLVLEASFLGSDQGTVRVGGQTAQVAGWPSGGSTVYVNFPTPGVGAGSAGDVIVTVRNHQSNIARLTEWQGPFTLNMTSSGGSANTLSATMTLNPAFRADIRAWRPAIHQPPAYGIAGHGNSMPETMIPGSNGQFACMGIAQLDAVTYAWVGAGNLTPFDASSTSPPPISSFAIVGTLENNNTTMNMAFTGSGLCTADITGAKPLTFGVGPPSPVLSLDPMTGIIQSGMEPFSAACPGPVLGCTGVFQWDSISPVANTAPDPKSAR